MATDNKERPQRREDDQQALNSSCTSSPYELGDITHKHRQPLLLHWEPFSAVDTSLQPSTAGGVTASAAAASCDSRPSGIFPDSGAGGGTPALDAAPHITLSYSVSGARSDSQDGDPSEAGAAAMSDTAGAVTVRPSMPFFALSSESAPVQQDVVMLSTSAGETGLVDATMASGSAPEPLASSPQYSSSNENASKASVALELLECGVCMERMQPPIYQCREGHTLCCNCRQRLSSCPTCRSPELNIRCRALEVLAQCLTDVPCRFANYGCTYTTRYSEVHQHESRCLRRPLACLHADNGCAFEASPQQLAEHLLQQHGYEYKPTSTIQFACTPSNCRGSRRLGPGSKTSSSLGCSPMAGASERPHQRGQEEEGEEPMFSLDGCESFVWQQQLYHCFGKYFVLRVHRRVDGEASFYLSLLALHPRHHCSRYSLQVSGNHRTYSFHGPVWSAARGPKELERVKDCLLLPENIALFLSGAKGSEQNLNAINLNVTGEILPS